MTWATNEHILALMMQLDHKKIELAMAEATLSQSQLATRGRYGESYLNRLLNKIKCECHVLPATAGRLATALGVRVETIIKEDAPDD